jgi:transposase InsO family protein
VLARDFEASAPDRKWLVDLTYVATDEGWLYLALVLDLYRKFVGWAMSERIDEDLALQALVMALEWRRPTGELMHHSDRGSQYAANEYRKVLAARGITVSMSRKASCWDTQSKIASERRTDLTRVGIGRAALALTCRSGSGVPRALPGSPSVT